MKRESHIWKTFKKMALCILATVWVFIHDVLDTIINFIFAYLYNGKKKNIPSINDPILLKSATALAEAIRKREVSHLFPHIDVIKILN